jgi:hypothetical protein
LKESLQRFEEFRVVIKVVPMVFHPFQKSGSDSVEDARMWERKSLGFNTNNWLTDPCSLRSRSFGGMVSEVAYLFCKKWELDDVLLVSLFYLRMRVLRRAEGVMK